MSLSDDKHAGVIDAFNTISRYLGDILNINNSYFDNMVSQIHPSELQLDKVNTSDKEAAFLDFNVFVLSCVCYVFVRVCLYVLCCHLLGKG